MSQEEHLAKYASEKSRVHVSTHPSYPAQVTLRGLWIVLNSFLLMEIICLYAHMHFLCKWPPVLYESFMYLQLHYLSAYLIPYLLC